MVLVCLGLTNQGRALEGMSLPKHLAGWTLPYPPTPPPQPSLTFMVQTILLSSRKTLCTET